MSQQTVLSAQAITKRYPGVVALDSVDFSLLEGEIHAIAGENGAGKSTLIRILTGVARPDSGTIVKFGMTIDRSDQFTEISLVPQELNLFANLTVAENILLPFRKGQRGGFAVSYRQLWDRSRKVLVGLGVSDIEPDMRVGALSTSGQQTVQIARAMAIDSRILILDEPTASLSYNEIENLLRILAQLRSNGKSIIYISHRLEELSRLADRLTILRDGKLISTCEMKTITQSEIVEKMAGKKLMQVALDLHVQSSARPIILKVMGLCGVRFQDVSFELREGEILGIAGLVGAGRTEVAKTIYGALPALRGSVSVAGKLLERNSIQRALKKGIVYVPEDRKQLGIFSLLSLKDNIVLPTLKTLREAGFINTKRERTFAETIVSRYSIKTTSLGTAMRNLSGGNQQKAVISRSISMEPTPRIVLLDEPTKGIDVNAKAEVYEMIATLARSGIGIVVISSEMDELFKITERIVVLYKGRQMGTFKTRDMNKELLLRAAMGIERQELPGTELQK